MAAPVAATSEAPDAPDWAALPAPCLARGLALLPPSAVAAATAAAACTCVAWRAATHDARLWRAALYGERFPPAGVRAASTLGMSAQRAHLAEQHREGAVAADDAAETRAAVCAARDARARMAAATPTRTRVLRGHTDFVRCLALRDEHMLLSAASSYALRDCSLRLWDVRSGACTARLTGHNAPIWCMFWRGGGSPAVTGSGDGTVGVWDVAAPQRPPLLLRGGDGRASSVALDASGRHCAGCFGDGEMVVWRLRPDGDAAGDAPSHAAEVAYRCPGSDAANSSGAVCVALSGAGDVVCWGTEDGCVVMGRVPAEGVAGDICCTEVAEAIATLSFDNTAIGPLADAMLVGTERGLFAVPFAMMAEVLPASMLASFIGTAQLAPGAAVTCHQQGVAGCDSVVAVGDQSGLVRLCDVRTPECDVVHVTPLHTGPPVLALHAVGHVLATGAADGDARLFDLRALGRGAIAANLLQGHTHRERLWALHLDERRVVTAGLDHVIAVRDWF